MSNGKEIFHGKDSREKLLKGVNELANAVKVTLGPVEEMLSFNEMVHHILQKMVLQLQNQLSFQMHLLT